MYSAIAKNKRNTILLLLFFVAIIGGLGAIVGFIYNSPSMVLLVIIGAGIYAAFQYFFAGRAAIAMAGGVEITEQDNPRLYRIVENLAIASGIPTPKVYIVHDSAPNAFATGRDPQHAMVAATTGLLELLNDEELEGVMAHEIGHVRNYDIRVNMVVYGLVMVIGMLADLLLRLAFFSGSSKNTHPVMLIFGLAALFVAPILATFVQLAISRQREYLADASGALLTRYPTGLASALHKLETHGKPLAKQNSSMAHMWIADPQRASLSARLYATHPPIPERIKRLLAMGEKF